LATHRFGSVVTPTVVIDGITVVPLIVAMQVLWQLNDCVLQPDRQVADVLLGVTGATLGVVVVWSVAWARRIS
jgi:hypothetical protein